MKIFRYRSLGPHFFDELTKDYMYFAPTFNENDVNEGRPLFILQGNKYFWLGVFKLYYIGMYNQYVYNKHDKDFYKYNDFAHTNIHGISNFLSDDLIRHLIEKLSNDKIYPYELNIIFIGLYYFCKDYILLGLIKSRYHSYYQINKLLYRIEHLKNTETFMKGLKNLLKYHHNLDRYLMVSNEKEYIRYSKHPKIRHEYFYKCKYMKIIFLHLYRLSIPKMYIVSFTNRFDNDNMWANYAHRYKGVCIEYKLHNNNIRFNKYSKGENDRKLYKVKYLNHFNTYNLFDYLDINNPDVKYMFNKIFDNKQFEKKFIFHDKSKQSYESKHRRMCLHAIIIKNKDWENENEYRLVSINNNLRNNKKYYKFNEVKSIILGKSLSLPEILKIIEILEIKCEENKVFNFPVYKIVRSNNGKINREKIIKLNLK